MHNDTHCTHENAEVVKACCPRAISGYVECACGGEDYVYCPDCNNDDMSDEELVMLMNGAAA